MNDALQLLVFDLDERRYGIRLSYVERVVRAVDVTPLPEAPANVAGVIDVQGKLVPLLNLRSRLGLAVREVALEDHFIIARTAERTVAVAVDRTINIVERSFQDIVKARDILPGGWEPIEGAIKLEDGLILIHDLGRFLSLDEQRVLDLAMGEGAPDGR